MLKHKIFANKHEIIDFVNLHKIKRIDIINIQKHETGYELFFFDKKGKYVDNNSTQNLFMYIMFVLLLIVVILQMVRVV